MRYIAEFSTADQKTAVSHKALRAYEEASGLAKQSLSNTHPLKLGLAREQERVTETLDSAALGSVERRRK